MKKIIFFLTTILILVLVAVVTFFSFPAPENQNFQGEQDKNKAKFSVSEEKIVSYLENSLLEPNFGGRVFADYYKIGQEEEELFIWVYLSEYYKENGELKQGTALSEPLKLSLGSPGTIKKHWEPRQGEDYAQSIKKEFSEEFVETALNFQTLHPETFKDLKRKVKEQAEQELPAEEEARAKKISVGEIGEIRLEANQTTGYSWHYEIDNKEIVEVISDKYIEPENEKGVLGAPGERVLEIKGLREGETFIKLDYYRDWQPEQVEKSRKVKIRVAGESRVDFEIPDLDTDYITARDWSLESFDSNESLPGGIEIEKGEAVCSPDYSAREINGEKYCLKKQTEGAAGKNYQEYTYITLKNNRLITLDFTLVYPNCGNYKESSSEECRQEQKNFKPRNLVKKAMESLKF